MPDQSLTDAITENDLRAAKTTDLLLLAQHLDMLRADRCLTVAETTEALTNYRKVLAELVRREH